MSEPRIFLSSVTRELGSYRDELARLLRTRGCVVKVQEEFQNSSGTLLEKLHQYLQGCHAVICLMGDRYGAEPPAAEATRFAFSFGAATTGTTPRHSYTQWEYLFARRMNKAVFVFVPSEKVQRDPTHLAAPESVDLLELQSSFFEQEIRLQGKDRSFFDSLEQLKDQVQGIDFNRLAQAEFHQVGLIKDSPYVGLRHFRETDRDYFFGRDELIADLLDASEKCPLLLVLGSSGSGKSSAVRAGVIPSWRRKHGSRGKVVVFNPDVDPFEGFYGGLLQAEFSQEEAKRARTPSSSLLRDCFEALRKPDEQWLIFIDQFEEIFTRTPKREDAQASLRQFVASLVDVAAKPGSGLRIILAMRDDFFSNLEGHKALCDITDENFRRVTRMSETELRAVIQNPAAAHGVSFEPGLVDRILREVEDPRGRLPLPLLQYTLDALWKKDDVSDRVLNLDTYDLIGGVKGALQQRVSGYYQDLGDEHKRSLRRILLRLVEIGEKEIPVSRAAHKTELDTDADREVMEQLLGREKLLVAKEGGGGERGVSTVELAHEALISGWSEFEGWIAESREAITLRNRLHHDAVHWDGLRKSGNSAEQRRANAEFWKGSRLERALELEREKDFEQIGGLTELELDFLRESESEKARELSRLRRRNAILSVLSVVALVAGGVALMKQKEAVQQRDEARYNEGLGWMLRAQVAEERHHQYPDTLLYAAQAIGFEGVGRPDKAPESLLRFIRQDRNPEAHAAARKWISDRPAYLPVWSSAPSPAPASGLDVSPDGRWLALGTSDGSVRLWDFLGNQETVILPSGSAPVLDLAFHPFAKRLDILTGDHLRHWDCTTAAFLKDDPATISHFTWSPGGTICAASNRDGSLSLWENNRMLTLPTGLKSAASSFSFSAENSACAAVFPGIGVRLIFPHYGALSDTWARLDESKASAVSEESRFIFASLARYVSQTTAVAMRPDGEVLVTGGSEGTIGLWQSSSAKLIGQASKEHRHSGAVLAVAFRPDGWQFATASADGTIRLWYVSEENIPTIIATLSGHRGPITALRYLPGGDLLASAGADGSARIWNVSGKPAQSQDLHAYLANHWYRLDPAAQQTLIPDGGSGFANVPPGSILGVWQAGGIQAFTHLMSTGEWNGAATLTTPTASPQLVTTLLADAKEAAATSHWSRAELRLGQLERLGSRDGSDLRHQQSSLAIEGQPLKNAQGIEMLWCQPGSFEMGSREAEAAKVPNETPHRVTLTQGYWLGKYELTQGQWTSIMGTNPSSNRFVGETAPAENMSWDDAMEFCARLTDRERQLGTIPTGWAYTLPTEAQWEYACRSGTTTRYNFGDDPRELHLHGNFKDKSSEETDADLSQDDGAKATALVGSYRPNPWGFHDMHGNVFEWCRDATGPKVPDYGIADATDPLETVGPNRINRGGGFRSKSANCRTALRDLDVPTTRISSLGLRIALVRLDH